MSEKIETRIIPELVPPKFFAQHLKPYEVLVEKVGGKEVLEVGCGDGYGAVYLAHKAKRVTAVDYDEETIQKAKAKYPDIRNILFMRMDATNLTFQDSTFDMICSFQVIEHIAENKIRQYLSEIKRVLKGGGEFYLTTLNLAHVRKSPLTYKKNDAHVKEFELEELQSVLSDVFPDVEIFGVQLTSKHQFFHFLKRAGVFRFLPRKINFVDYFYANVTPADFKISTSRLKKSIDFFVVCGNKKWFIYENSRR